MNNGAFTLDTAPTQKQLNAIKLAKSFVTDDFGANPTLSETLNELLEQLKKLRE